MTKVKIRVRNSTTDLENIINTDIRQLENDGAKIINIEYRISEVHDTGCIRYSAMIVYAYAEADNMKDV